MADLRMPDINRVTIAGRLTRDPELRYFQSDTAVCKLGIAVSRKFKTKTGETREETLFVNATVWGQSGEWVGERLKKGAAVLVEGSLKSSEWEDKATGQKRTAIDINATRVQPLAWEDRGGQGGQGGGGNYGGGQGGGNAGGGQQGGGQQGGGNYGGYSDAPSPRNIEEPIPEDDIPF
jgi:single-strand DNA-binding protein